MMVIVVVGRHRRRHRHWHYVLAGEEPNRPFVVICSSMLAHLANIEPTQAPYTNTQ